MTETEHLGVVAMTDAAAPHVTGGKLFRLIARHFMTALERVAVDDNLEACHRLACEVLVTTAAPQDHLEPVAWLRHGEYIPIQNCPFGAMWISDKDDPRASPVYAAQPPSQAMVFPSKDEIRRIAELALEEMQRKGIADAQAWTVSYEKVIMSYRRLALAKQQIADRDQSPAPNVGVSKWAGWDQSNLPWSEAKHKDRVCYAAFGDAWSMGDATVLIGFIEKTWPPAGATTGDELLCPVRLAAFKPDDTCATDIELGICHAACLEGSPIVDLDTGEETGGEVDTYPYSEAMDPAPATKVGGNHEG